MLFNSVVFLSFFLPSFIISKVAINFFKLSLFIAIFVIIFFSIIFYAYWEKYQVIFLLFSIIFNFSLSKLILINYKNKKIYFIAGVAINILFLFYFKYTNFLFDNISALTSINLPSLNIILPLAISFYTFQQISYLYDIYNRKFIKVSFLNYFLYVSFFPQLIAGPIVNFSEFNYQVKKIKRFNFKFFQLGFFLFTFGLLKKLLIADYFGIHVDDFYNNINDEIQKVNAHIIFFYYTFQIYFDFSAYSDMAIGIALMCNIRLPINFFSPLRCTNISDFWKTWHITLSRFIEKFLFNPSMSFFIKKFKNTPFIYSNGIFLFPLLYAFGLSGLWHGSNWNFIIWGLLHAFYLFIYIYIKDFKFVIPKIFKQFFLLIIVSFAFIFFRSPDLHTSFKFIIMLFNSFTFYENTIFHLITFFFISLFCFYSKNLYEIIKYRNPQEVFEK
tara:strand:- start:2966 stop:4294 length:1329 start_codon:yes stop_codon:yes gene_type:complete